MSEHIEPIADDRRQGDRRAANLAKARKKRWKDSTPESRRELAKQLNKARWGNASERRRREMILAKVWIPKAVYDRYCRCAVRAKPNLNVSTVLRHILTLHAPSP